MPISQEKIKKAMGCKTEAELIALAKAEGIDVTAEEAAKFFASLSEKKVNLDELENVSGGACVGNVCGVDC